MDDKMANQSRAKRNRLYEQLVERFARWAETCSDTSAVIIIGSSACARVTNQTEEQ